MIRSDIARHGTGLECTIVDVFAENPLSGNQLAVVRGGGHLNSEEMQAIALEMNFSETSFVLEEWTGGARVRIFTTVRELPFAGHPTLGTAWVLSGGCDSCTLDLPAGKVCVTFGDGGMAWMLPPPVELGGFLSVQSVAALVGLREHEIDTRYSSRFATVGPWFALLGVRGLDALRCASVQTAAYEEISGGEELAVFIFTEGSYSDDAHFAARMFHHKGSREDPATGSANAAFAAHLRSFGKRGSFVVEQGFEMGRPSRLYLEVGEAIRVGGKVRPVLTGRFNF